MRAMKCSAIPDPVIVPLSSNFSSKDALGILAQPVSPIDPRQLKVNQFIEGRSLSPKTEQAYRRDLQHFMEWTPQAWGDVTRWQVAQFKRYLLQDRKFAPNSVNRILRTLKTFYKWLLMSEQISADPTVEIILEKVQQPLSQGLNKTEIEQIYAAIAEISGDPVRDRALFSVLLHGLRAEEAINLNFEDYDGRQVTIRDAKQDNSVNVPLTESARLHLNAHMQQAIPQSPLFTSNSNRSKGKRLTYWGVQELMKRLALHTGIDLQAHRGRQTFCANLVVQLEADMALALRMSRYRDIRSVKRYANREN